MGKGRNMDSKFMVPMFESERGWGSKIDGYSGPFESFEAARDFQRAFNLKYNSEDVVPDYYIKALDPVNYDGRDCVYKSTVPSE